MSRQDLDVVQLVADLSGLIGKSAMGVLANDYGWQEKQLEEFGHKFFWAFIDELVTAGIIKPSAAAQIAHVWGSGEEKS